MTRVGVGRGGTTHHPKKSEGRGAQHCGAASPSRARFGRNTAAQNKQTHLKMAQFSACLSFARGGVGDGTLWHSRWWQQVSWHNRLPSYQEPLWCRIAFLSACLIPPILLRNGGQRRSVRTEIFGACQPHFAQHRQLVLDAGLQITHVMSVAWAACNSECDTHLFG